MTEIGRLVRRHIEHLRPTMLLGYNTNGFAHHRLADVVPMLAALGYQAVALTPDVHHLDPFHTPPADVDRFAELLHTHNLTCVVETGARFLLDPQRKHQPTLVSPNPADRDRRLAFLKDCVGLVRRLGGDVVSFWSGTPTDDAEPEVLFERLSLGCRSLAEHAAEQGVRLAFEPEPGMFVESVDQFRQLFDRVHHPAFGLTLDVGHLVCTGEVPIGDHLRAWAEVLWNVHLDDMRPGVHDHLMFGDGVVDFTDVLTGLRDAHFTGVASVELSRHSHDAVRTATASKHFWDRLRAAVV